MGLKNRITKQQLIQQIGEENIYTKYFGPWTYNTSYHSVLREDQKKSTGFFLNNNGNIIYNDFACSKKYDCIAFVMKLYSLSYSGALTKIAADFNIQGEQINVQPITIQNKKPYRKAYNVHTTSFKAHHLAYWAQYSITLAELQAANIHAVDGFTINKFDENDQLISSYNSPHTNDLKFVYIFDEPNGEKSIKIYMPYNKDYKWFGNVSLTTIFGIDDLTYKTDTLIITKSVKDTLILKKYFTDVVGLQNESPFSIEKDVISYLCKKYKYVYFWFDTDRPGLQAVNYYYKTYNIIPILIGNKNKSLWQNLTAAKKNTIKDPSDFVKKFGLETFEQYLKYINLKQ